MATVALDPLSALREQIEIANGDPELDPVERVAKLRELRERLAELAGVADRYITSTERLREAELSEQARLVMQAREQATLRETLLRNGEFSAEELDEVGMLSHAELDRLEEEGLLNEAIEGIARAAYDEAKHPRGRGGKWTHSDFFHPHPAATLVSTDRLRTTRKDTPEHISKARRYAMEAANGRRQKRKPLDVRENGDGTLSIVDGNSTFEALKGELTHFPAVIGEGDAGDAATERAAEEIGKAAVKAERDVTPALKTVTAESGGKLERLSTRLKPHESIKSKIARKQEKYPGLPANVAAKKVKDGLRYTAVFPDDSYSEGVQKTLSALGAQGYHAAEVKNYWGGSDDYDGVHADLVNAAGTHVELQFHTPDSLGVADKKNHALYAQFRESHDAHERYLLWTKMVENSSQIPIPAGVDALGEMQVSPSAEERARRHETSQYGGAT